VLTIEKLQSCKLPGIVQIPAELIKARGRTIRCEIHNLIISVWNKEKLPGEWKQLIIVPIYKKGFKQITVIKGAYHFANIVQNIQNRVLKVNSICSGDYW
jgi:hypothetical protein